MTTFAHTYRVNNWFCERCQRWLATEDMNEAKRHRECKEKADWRLYEPSRDFHDEFERRQTVPVED